MSIEFGENKDIEFFVFFMRFSEKNAAPFRIGEALKKSEPLLIHLFLGT
jgi:hypothetical protein